MQCVHWHRTKTTISPFVLRVTQQCFTGKKISSVIDVNTYFDWQFEGKIIADKNEC